MAVKLNIEGLLSEKGYTLYRLAKETRIAHTVMHRYRHNKSDGIKLDHIQAICDVLDCQPADLFLYKKTTRRVKK